VLVQKTALAASVDDSVAGKGLNRKYFILFIRVVELFDLLQVAFVVFKRRLHPIWDAILQEFLLF